MLSPRTSGGAGNGLFAGSPDEHVQHVTPNSAKSGRLTAKSVGKKSSGKKAERVSSWSTSSFYQQSNIALAEDNVDPEVPSIPSDNVDPELEDTIEVSLCKCEYLHVIIYFSCCNIHRVNSVSCRRLWKELGNLHARNLAEHQQFWMTMTM